MADPGPPPTPRPPGRALLRVAGVLTQLSCGACLLIGTIGLVLVEQNRAGGIAAIAAWLVTAMAGLVFGGLIYRGGLVSMLIAAAIDAGFGLLLATFDLDALRRLLKILGDSDVVAIHGALGIAGFAMIGTGAVCLIALPQGIRYARWFRDAAATRTAMSTARGFPPPPVPVRTATYIIPAEQQPASRRRLYLIMGGVAIFAGAAIGGLVSSTRSSSRSSSSSPPPATARGSARPAVADVRAPDAGVAPAVAAVARAAGTAAGPGSAAVTAVVTAARDGAGSAAVTAARDGAGSAAVTAARDGAGSAAAAAAPATGTVQDLVLAQHAALARADRKALAGLLASEAFGFGIDAGEVAEGRDAVAAQVAHDLGEPPPGGFTVESRAIAIGEDRGSAWIAEQLEVSGGDGAARTFAVSELAAVIDGHWRAVALHWATPVDDATAERLAILSRLPAPARIVDRHDGSSELDQAVRAAFASRAAFAEARSERPDGFNYGSGGERAHGGAAIKRIFSRLKAEIRIHDGARVVAGSAWDPAQQAAPRIGWAALDVDYTARTRAGTDVTQVFRVLAILIKEPGGWKIVQTQWSNAGPIR